MTTTAIEKTNVSTVTRAEDLPPDRNPALVYFASLTSDASKRTMDGALATIACIATNRDPAQLDTARKRDLVRAFPWHRLDYQHTAAIRAKLAATYSPATANKALAALRGTLKAAWRLGLMDSEVYHRSVDLPGVKGQTLPAGRALDAGEIVALVNACKADATDTGKRDTALLAVLYSGGLRRSEAVGLDLADYSAETGELRVIRGKGRKDRITYATNGAGEALRAWIEARGDHAGPLFHPTLKGGRIIERRMADQSVLDILRKLARRADVKSFSPHDLRRTFISTLLDTGNDIATVQRLAGHANVGTTQRYDRRPEAAKRKAAETLHFPFAFAA